MLRIENTKVYDLEESVIACRNSMRLVPPEYTEEEFRDSLLRAEVLSKQGGGSGHTNFRVGIRVSFDLYYPQYVSPELQRYHFFDIVCSSSKMHRLARMDTDRCFNKYVTDYFKEGFKGLMKEYNTHPTYENFMTMVSCCPQGLELFMRCSTNYEQLATIYRQRKSHKLKEDWGAFCEWIETLPYFDRLIAPDEGR